MKKYLSVLFLFPLFISLISYGQDTTKIGLVKDKIVRLYNQNKMAAIYDLADSSFEKFIPKKNFVQQLSQIKQKFGPIRDTRQFDTFKKGVIYKSEFGKGEKWLELVINQYSKMTGILLRSELKKQKAYSDNPLENAVDSLVENEIRPYIQQIHTVGLSIGIIYGGKTYSYNYGEISKGKHQLPTTKTIYEIGSITKTFTATLLAELSLQGKCKLDDPVNKYLPDSVSLLQKENIPITLKMLANHTSGLPRLPSNLFLISNSQDPYKNYDDKILFGYLDSVQLRSVPGAHFVYSNLGFGLLGTILEKIGGLTYEQLLEKYICDPLGMNDTRIQLNDKQRRFFAPGYNSSGEAVEHWHFKSLAGGGAIRSSVNDLLKYLQVSLDHDTSTTLNSAFHLCEQPTFQLDNGQMGLAWHLSKKLPGVYWKNGGTGGFRSYCAYDPDKKVAVVLLANSIVSVDRPGIELVEALSKK